MSETVECLGCGKMMVARRAGHRYCAPKCRVKKWQRDNPEAFREAKKASRQRRREREAIAPAGAE